MIEFHEVSKQFGSTTVLEQINFVIQPGEFAFITGPSGSGKTTLMRLIISDLQPDHGQINVSGKDITRLHKSKVPLLRQQIGMVFQDFKLLPEQTIYENIALPLRVKGLSAKQIHDQVIEIATQVGIQDRLGVFPSQIAGGELQRSSLARAVINNPEILLADEPTGNLDPATSWQIMQLIDNINKQGTTIIMATHNMDIVNSMNKRVLHIENGKLVSDATEGKYEV